MTRLLDLPLHWLPYAAALIAGAALFRFSRVRSDRDALILGVAVAFSLGLLNFVGPHVGLATDLPGPTASLAIALLATPVTAVLALAGAGIYAFSIRRDLGR